MTTTTARDEAQEKALPESRLIKAADAEVCPARTRAKNSLIAVTARGRALARHWARQGGQTWDGLWETSLAEQHPASPRDLRRYIHSAAWVPGEVPLLEFLGRLYGYLVAVPVSLALYTIAWVLQRPGRALLTGLVGVLIWITL